MATMLFWIRTRLGSTSTLNKACEKTIMRHIHVNISGLLSYLLLLALDLSFCSNLLQWMLWSKIAQHSAPLNALTVSQALRQWCKQQQHNCNGSRFNQRLFLMSNEVDVVNFRCNWWKAFVHSRWTSNHRVLFSEAFKFLNFNFINNTTPTVTVWIRTVCFANRQRPTTTNSIFQKSQLLNKFR